MKLTSLDYTRLIAWLAYYKFHVLLGKTQMQKILYVCYGLYLVKHNEEVGDDMNMLFTDDSPKAWPFGPVFPRSYRTYIGDKVPSDITDEDKAAFMEDPDTLRNIVQITQIMCRISARDLTKWSHQVDSPWSRALFPVKGEGLKWNEPISNSDMFEYFGGREWIISLEEIS